MFYEKKLWKTLSVVAIVVCAMLFTSVPPAQACNSGGGGIIIVPHFTPPFFWLLFTGLRITSASDMAACFVGISADGIIQTVHGVELVDAETGQPFAGFDFSPESQVTNTLAPITGDTDWQGFFTTVADPPEEGLAAELHFEVSLVEGATTKDLMRVFKTYGLIASGSADAGGREPNFYHFTIQRPTSVTTASE